MARSLAICVVTLLTIGSMTLIVKAKNSSSSISNTPSSPTVSSSSSIASSSSVAPSSSVTPSIAPSSSISTSSLAAPSSSKSIYSSTMVSPSLSTSHVSKSVLTSTILTSSQSSSVSPSTVATTSYVPSSSPSPPSPSPPAHTEQKVHFNDMKNPNVSCLKAQFSVSFNVAYTSNQTKNTSNIPLNAHHKAHGNCSSEDGYAIFVISWNQTGGDTGPTHQFVMEFKLDSKKHQWFVPSIRAIFNTRDSRFIDANKKAIFANASGSGSIGFVQSQTYYVCESHLGLQMNGGVNAMFKHLKLQPFSTDTNFTSAGKKCAADNKSHGDDNSNTVPIAVGAALGGLVLIVLIAYIIGRRRSKSGYEQV
ncbi:lysosome-associated membrane glycoprotein 1-like isoform X2 [Xenia sp. Carnegie-2017]|uniref:lysosome-associated membrane glycoprotein 1-like isoform X2 n=1 Tax=Xenia sp. Carnegie-2017 TaxID=2897299 RepID=UPI001F03A822|nr:lysosome-associated membrane glycoprotein 1-like isoform X2 [Xenia sp. Carnegie-2017]